MNVIIAMSDDHGIIGVAKSYKSAIDCLLDWTGNELCYHNDLDGYNYLTNKEDFDKIYNLDIEEFNKKFEGIYSLQIEPLW